MELSFSWLFLPHYPSPPGDGADGPGWSLLPGQVYGCLPQIFTVHDAGLGACLMAHTRQEAQNPRRGRNAEGWGRGRGWEGKSNSSPATGEGPA